MSAQKDRGRYFEHKTVEWYATHGVDSKRVPGSGMFGAAADELKSDVRLGTGQRVEVKVRKNATGWKTIKEWIQDCPILFLWENKTPPLVVLTAEEYGRLLKNQRDTA